VAFWFSSLDFHGHGHDEDDCHVRNGVTVDFTLGGFFSL
jgi:hypothetical protein